LTPFRQGARSGTSVPSIRLMVSPMASARATDPLCASPVRSFRLVSPEAGSEAKRPFCGPGFGTSPAAKASIMAAKPSGVRSS
jgi:hypothetical protein